MRVLLDTHAFLWWLADDPRLRPTARSILADPGNRLVLSTVSAWEIALKATRGRLRVSMPVDRVLTAIVADARVERLPIEFGHVVAAAGLPGHHGDPFDRMLVAQAQALGCPIMTRDPNIARYAVETIW